MCTIEAKAAGNDFDVAEAPAAQSRGATVKKELRTCGAPLTTDSCFLFLGVLSSRKLLGVRFAQAHHDPVNPYILNLIGG